MQEKNIRPSVDEIRKQLKDKWTKFTENEVKDLSNNLSLLTNKLVTRYSFSKDDAKKKADEFIKSVKITPAKMGRKPPEQPHM